jgi:heat shock protein HslJ
MRTVILVSAAAATLAGCGSATASDPLAGTTWRLVSIESMSDEQPTTTIDDPAKYTVEFGDDGRAAFQVDCNRGNGSWTAAAAASDSGSLTFGPIALTRMFCPQPSVDTTVAAGLGRVRSYLLSDGKLHLSMEADSGIMHWEPQPGGTGPGEGH